MTLRQLLRQPLGLVLGGVVAGALVFLTGAPAAAHASLVSSDPSEGAVVASAPAEIVLTFNEPVRLESGGVRAFDAAGDDWKVDAVSRDNLVVVTPAGDPGTGTVVVSWKVTSEDGHEVSGALTFAIGEASPGGSDHTAPDAPVSVTVARVALAASSVLGLVACLGLALSGRERAADLAWNVGLGATVLLGPLHSLATNGRGLGGLTDWLAWLDGLVSRSSLLLLAAYAVVAVARRASRRALVAATIPALALVVASAFTWPATEQVATTASTAEAGPTTNTGELGDHGSVELTVTPGPTAGCASTSRFSPRTGPRSSPSPRLR